MIESFLIICALSRPLRPELLLFILQFLPPQRGILNVAWGNVPGNVVSIQTTLKGLLNAQPASGMLKKPSAFEFFSTFTPGRRFACPGLRCAAPLGRKT